MFLRIKQTDGGERGSAEGLPPEQNKTAKTK